MNNLEDLIYARTKAGITKAYASYVDNPVEGEADLLKVILAFAKSKISRATFDLPEGGMTEEDYAQEVAMFVWSNIHTFSGQPDVFYSWLHRICFAEGVRAFRENRREQAKRVPLFVPASEDSGDSGEMEDNPLLYQNQDETAVSVKIPEYVKGDDLIICQWILQGYDYKTISKMTGLTVSSIKSRIKRLKQKPEQMKSAPEKTQRGTRKSRNKVKV